MQNPALVRIGLLPGLTETQGVRDSCEQLLVRIGQGDHRAFEELYDELVPLLMGLAVRIVGNHAAAEDVVQEAFIHIWRRAAGYDQRLSSARGWASMILRSRAVDYLRHRAAQRVRNDSLSALDQRGDPDSVDAPPLEGLNPAEILKDLPPHHAEALILAYVYGRSREQIAEHLGVPIGTVKTWMRTAQINLRHRYRAHNDAGHEETRS